MELRELFGRNINITKEARKIYDDLEQGFIFQKMVAKNIFMLSLALAYAKKAPRKEIKRYPLLNTDSFSDEDLWLLVSIAVEETGSLDILSTPNELKKIVEEYSIAGLKELQMLTEEYRTTDNFLMILEKKIKESLANKSGESNLRKSGLHALKEDQLVEFKSSVEWDYKQNRANKELVLNIAKAICGFMNTDGGRLIIGIDDDKKVLGIEKDFGLLKKPTENAFQLKISELVCHYLGKESAQLIDVTFQNIEDKKIASLTITKSSSPIYLEDKDSAIFYIRTGNSTRPLNSKEANAYIKNHWS